MSLPEPIQGLDEIADRYDVVLSDVWGVIHNGRERFEPPAGPWPPSPKAAGRSS